jgi:thiol:disulfide interchange protein DsbG
MRDILPFLLIASALATNCPAMAQDAPHCALEAPAQMIEVADAVGAAASEPAAAKSAEAAEAEAIAKLKAAADGLGAGVLGAPSDVDRVPVLKHIAGTGAKLLELGSAHGVRTVSVRHDQQFMLLQVAPDGEAVVSGPQLDLSVSTLMTVAGGQVTELGEAHGLRGLYLRNGQEFQVLYATPDGKATIAGVMWDANGKNLTREHVARIDGAVPTVVVGKDQAAAPTLAKPVLNFVEKTTFGLSGSADAPRMWMFVDPLCSYSVRALQQLRPYVEQGRIQLALIPISVLDYEDNGQSTPAALALLSRAPNQMAEAWSHRDFGGAPAAEAVARLRANMAAAEAIGLRGTPTLVWNRADGTAGRIDGLPNDWSAVIASIGGASHVVGAR